MPSKFMGELYKAAQKHLGDKAKFPKERGNLDKAVDDVNKAYADFVATRDKLEDNVLALENAFSALGNTVKQNTDVFSNDDFGLNPKDKGDAKKIKDAQGEFSRGLGSFTKSSAKSEKEIDELDKHCTEMGKYKSPDTKL